MNDTKRRIDWAAVKARLRTLQAGPDRSSARLEAVYRQRAQDLAARIDQAGPVIGRVQVLAFTVGVERYGLPLTELAGVLPLTRWTPVPGGPAELLGVINHRGHICSVLDLARLLTTSRDRQGALPDGRGSYILLLRRPGREIGLRVDGIDAIREVAPDALVAIDTRYAEHRTRDGLTLLRAESIRIHPLLAEESSP
jgi:purine-binding chemotaxis protein CheW